MATPWWPGRLEVGWRRAEHFSTRHGGRAGAVPRRLALHGQHHELVELFITSSSAAMATTTLSIGRRDGHRRLVPAPAGDGLGWRGGARPAGRACGPRRQRGLRGPGAEPRAAPAPVAGLPVVFLDFNPNLEGHWGTFDLRSVAWPDPAVVGVHRHAGGGVMVGRLVGVGPAVRLRRVVRECTGWSWRAARGPAPTCTGGLSGRCHWTPVGQPA